MTDAGWQPIETAPKEHMARFLVWFPYWPAGQVLQATRYDDEYGTEIRLDSLFGLPNEKFMLSLISHWRPLLEPPTS